MKYVALAVMVAFGLHAQPAGKQVQLDTFPMASALSKDGKHLLVLTGGLNPPSVIVLQADTMAETSRTPVPDGWLGLCFSPDGKSVYVGGGSRASVYEFAWADGKLTAGRTLAIIPEDKRTPKDFIGDVAISPDGRMLYAAGLYDNTVHVVNLQSGRVIEHFPTGRRPYRILPHPDGKSYFVSSWADATVYHHNALNGERLGFVRLGQHTTDMVYRARKSDEKDEQQARWAGRLFVTASNTNTVFVVGVTESKDIERIESINVALTALQPAGSTPTALAMNRDQSRLFVACSDLDAIAVVDISEARSSLEGFVPVGGYPTAVRVMPSGQLVALNGEGKGSASVIDLSDDQALLRFSRSVLANSGYRDELMDAPAPSSPIQHVVYILKDGGSGENLEKLGREFVRFDQFQLSGEHAAERYNWAFAGIASDYIRKLSPNSEAGRRKTYDFDSSTELAALPPAGYLWSNANSAGVSLRNYGLKPTNGATVIADLQKLEQSGTMPRLTILRLGNDDASLGAIVEAVSKTKFWPTAAIFVLQLDATSPKAAIASPYTRRGGFVDSTPYNTLSMLRTVELILGLRPMTIFDGAAAPMWKAFAPKPDTAPYASTSR